MNRKPSDSNLPPSPSPPHLSGPCSLVVASGRRSAEGEGDVAAIRTALEATGVEVGEHTLADILEALRSDASTDPRDTLLGVCVTLDPKPQTLAIPCSVCSCAHIGFRAAHSCP